MKQQRKQLVNGLDNAAGYHIGIETHYNCGGSNACFVIVARE